MCILCRDTFSRSDILKRHFQKCSIRRGNPTGASHLSHSQAHIKKSHSSPHIKTTNDNTMIDINSMGGSNGGMQMFGVNLKAAVAYAGANLSEQQAEKLHSGSLKRLSTNGENDGSYMTAMGPGVTSRCNLNSSYAGCNG